jgi:predicted nucleic acid-binding Zn ribbon protein
MTYLWACQTCGKIYEAERRIADIEVPPQDHCTCGGELRRGICPVPHVGEKVKGRMNSVSGDLG